MTTTTTPHQVSPASRVHPQSSGWVPESDLLWLEELREEHERAVAERRSTVEAVADLERRQTALRAEYDEAVAEAARADVDPPPFPGRLEPRYEQIQTAAAADARDEAAAALDAVILRVRDAVGKHRSTEGWAAATAVEEGAPADSPGMLLRAFGAQWSWPKPGPSSEERRGALEAAEAEIEAATVEYRRLSDEANAQLASWRERVRDAEAAGKDRPPQPDLTDDLLKRSHAETRLQRAFAERDRLQGQTL